MAETHNDRERFDGWKRIADYLNRSVKTAQRWEVRNGLPVHRLPGSAGTGSVYAFRDELDEWLRGESAPAGAEIDDARGLGTTGTGLGRRLVVGLVGLVGASVLAVSLVWHALGPIEVANVLIPDSRRIVAVDADGRELWTRVESVPFDVNLRGRPAAESLDLDGDGSSEVLFAVRQEGELHRVMALSRSGDPLWIYEVGREIQIDDMEYRNSFGLWTVLPMRVQGAVRIAVISHHKPWFPSLIDWLDGTTGERVGSYVHSGYLFDSLVRDLDGDASDELVVGGYNNLLESPVVAALEVIDGTAVSPGPDRHDPFAGRGRERAYLRFRRSLVGEALGRVSWVRAVLAHDDLIRIDVRLDGPDEIEERVYLVTGDLELERVDFPLTFEAFHQEMLQTGRIDHELRSELVRAMELELLVDNRGRE